MCWEVIQMMMFNLREEKLIGRNNKNLNKYWDMVDRETWKITVKPESNAKVTLSRKHHKLINRTWTGHSFIPSQQQFISDFRDSCFASTQCKVHAPGEGWSLAPFCGRSKCVKLESGRLAEEVTDCGPVVDVEASPGCQLVKDGADPKADFPACCPVYDCEEGAEVRYVKTPAQKKKEAAEAAAAAAAAQEE